MKMELRVPLSKTLRQKIEPHVLEVGILENKIHKSARKGTKSYAGGPARRLGKLTTTTVASVAAGVRKKLGFNYLKRPFEKKSSEIVKLVDTFIRFALGGSAANKKRLENLLAAIVRGPFLKNQYGRNTKQTARAKGFNRLMIDTSQFVSNIKGRLTRRGRR